MPHLEKNASELLERWRQEMLRLPLPARGQVMEGEAEEVTARLAAAVLDVVDNEGASALFQAGGDAYANAEELGRLRRRQGFSMQELVREHVIMRNEFWNLFREQVDMKHVVDFHLEKRVNGCFDLLLQAAASAYHYEHSKEIMENPLRDAETGLYNKSYFHGRLLEELRRSVRYRHDITLVLCELGNFRQVVELEGEDKTPELLKFIATSLDRMTRDCDVVARLGEGSFAALLPETGWRGGRVMAERLGKYFQRLLPPIVSGECALELRWGMASFPEEVRLPEKLYACAMEALRASHSLPPGEIAVYRSSEGGEGG